MAIPVSMPMGQVRIDYPALVTIGALTHNLPFFIAVTAGLSATERRRIAVKATLISAAILLFFLIAGQVLLEALDIHLEAFQIAGGIVLFLCALTMIFGDSKI